MAHNLKLLFLKDYDGAVGFPTIFFGFHPYSCHCEHIVFLHNLQMYGALYKLLQILKSGSNMAESETSEISTL